MKVALLGLKKDFDNKDGQGPGRYISMFYRELKQNKDCKITKFETITSGFLGWGKISHKKYICVYYE